jgi:hypothetical protein
MIEVLLHHGAALDLLKTASCGPCCYLLPLSLYLQDSMACTGRASGVAAAANAAAGYRHLLLCDASPEVPGSSCSGFIWQHTQRQS